MSFRTRPFILVFMKYHHSILGNDAHANISVFVWTEVCVARTQISLKWSISPQTCEKSVELISEIDRAMGKIITLSLIKHFYM